MASFFEFLMMVCFGVSWPFSVYKSYKYQDKNYIGTHNQYAYKPVIYSGIYKKADKHEKRQYYYSYKITYKKSFHVLLSTPPLGCL